MAETVAILGAGSSIGRAIAQRLASQGAQVWLLGRDVEELERSAKDVTLRHGADAHALFFDALDFDAHEALVERLDGAAPSGLDGVVLVYGEMADQEHAQRDLAVARHMIDVNYVSAVSLLERFAARMEARGRGFLCAVTSVAGDRGRASNYLYGSSKAALQSVLSGMRARLAKRGVRVVDVRPGFVDTALTWGRPGVVLPAAPATVARHAVAGIRRDRGIVYTPRWWRAVMLAIRWLPDFLFKRLGL